MKSVLCISYGQSVSSPLPSADVVIMLCLRPVKAWIKNTELRSCCRSCQKNNIKVKQVDLSHSFEGHVIFTDSVPRPACLTALNDFLLIYLHLAPEERSCCLHVRFHHFVFYS